MNGKNGLLVNKRTILHHIESPWLVNLPEQAYYFCDDPSCDVVCFSQFTQSIILSFDGNNLGVCVLNIE